MPANTSPIFTLTPQIGIAQISTANTNRDGTGTLGSVITGAANGTRIHEIVVKATVTTTAGVIRLFLDNGAGTIRLWKEYLVTAITPSGTVAAFSNSDVRSDNLPLLVLPSGWILKAGTNNAETFNVIAYGGDF